MKKRSRDGCQTCRARKVKCNEEHPVCSSCKKKGLVCEYGIRWNWVHQPGPAFHNPVTPCGGQDVFVLNEVEYDSDDSLNIPVKKFKLETVKPPQPHMPVSQSSYTAMAESAALSLADHRNSNNGSSLLISSNPLINATDIQYAFEHFVSSTAPNLVPVPYDDNPYIKLFLPLALNDVHIYKVCAAYGAVNLENVSDTREMYIASALVDDCIYSLKQLPENDFTRTVVLTMLALMEIDRGNIDSWVRHTGEAADLISKNSNSVEFYSGENAEVNSVLMRLVGYMIALGNICGPMYFVNLHTSWWPQWTGSLDYLTGLDLNFIPLYRDTALLIRRRSEASSLGQVADINTSALKILQQLNDYWLEEFWPDSQLTAMCLLFQMALQVHTFRLVLKFSIIHREVRRLLEIALITLSRFIPIDSPIQNHMTFILVTLASEAISPNDRQELIERMQSMQKSGFIYNTYAMHDIQRCWQTGKSLIMEPNMNVFL